MRFMERELNTTLSVKWDHESLEYLEDEIIRLKAEGELDNAVTKAESIRRILENWTENPDSAMLESVE
jgi:hypothetical protein